MQAKTDDLDVEGKNLLIPLGASRTGKGTLLASLRGYKLKLFKKKDLKGNPIAKDAATTTFLAPCDPQNEEMPIELDFISHKRNSHTFYPKLIGQPIECYNDS